MSDSNEDVLKEISNQNKTIISLLGRLVFPEEKLISIIQKKSKKPKEILKAYNLCNGNLTISEIAKKAEITQQSLSETIPKWRKMGIITINPSHKGMEVKPQCLYEINNEKNM